MSILCVGQIVADVVARPVDKLPVPGRTDLVQDIQLIAGGCAANTACVLAKLGVDASVAGLVGKDSMGDAVLADLTGSGVNTTRVLRSPVVPTSAVLVLVDSSGERSFVYRVGGNEQFSNDHIPDSAICEADWLHVGGAMKLAKLDLALVLSRAKEAGCTTSLDTDWDVTGRWMANLQAALVNVDYLLTNLDEGSMLAKSDDPSRIGKFLLPYGPSAVIIKRGKDGATLVTDSECIDFASYRVDVVDTTCAGDAFAAGFIHAISQGRSPGEAVAFANAAGALATTDLSHSGITSLSQVKGLSGIRSESAITKDR